MKKKYLTTAGGVILCLVLAAVAFGQISLRKQLKDQTARMAAYMDNTREELGMVAETQDVMKDNTRQVRQYMNLPPLSFPSAGEEEPESSEPDATDFELAAYDAVSFLSEYNDSQELQKEFSLFLEDPGLTGFLKETDLAIRKKGTFDRILEKGGTSYFSINYIPEDRSVEVGNILYGDKASFSEPGEGLQAFLRDGYNRQSDAYRKVSLLNRQLDSLYRDAALKSVLREKELYLGAAGSVRENRQIPILRKDESVLAVVRTDTLSSAFRFGDQEYADAASLSEGVVAYLKTADVRTDAEILDDLVRTEIRTLLEDSAFLAYLGKQGYVIADSVREDNDYLYFDLMNGEDREGALALQKDFGEVYLMDKEDIPIRSLRTFSPSHELSFSFQEEAAMTDDSPVWQAAQGSETFLLIGSHEHNADTMILAHCNSATGEIVMLSIPRDLYYKGQKINSIYRKYGVERLASDLSAITGLNITRYVSIDMYAFIDVINILGGVDVELDEPLIDPTYKIRENGKWSTLYYPAGEHHLDGIAALRIARSRHTSSDFERAIRQQKVIAALKDSIAGMGLSDMGRIYDFMQIAGKYLQTNISTTEMVRYFLAYKDYNINGQNVLNTDNVLYATYTNLYRLSPEEQQKALENTGFYKGGWIVLPKNNDWSIIKTYIQSVMASS